MLWGLLQRSLVGNQAGLTRSAVNCKFYWSLGNDFSFLEVLAPNFSLRNQDQTNTHIKQWIQLCNITFYCMYSIAENMQFCYCKKKVGEKCQNIAKIVSGWISADSCGAQMFNIRGFGQKLLIISRSVYFPLDKSFESFSTWDTSFFFDIFPSG